MKAWIPALALVALVIFSGPAQAQTETRCRVSMAQYTQVQSGWTYAQVRELFGCDGIEMSSSDIAGFMGAEIENNRHFALAALAGDQEGVGPYHLTIRVGRLCTCGPDEVRLVRTST
jgi:hypothetical protein